ncbi:MAG TPA: hypothetical protein VKK61_06605 [Tepidisphaeraceae bacterium]|nr:hypothetical protein [Tepidisphaeraceae bacterium]
MGIILLDRGLRSRRIGQEPHCRRCDYLLIGLSSNCCPECGAELSRRNIVHGNKRNQASVAWIGAAALVLGLTMAIGVITAGIVLPNFYHYLPTFILMRELQPSINSWHNAAFDELNRRDLAGELSAKYQNRLIDVALQEQPAAAPGQLTQALIDFAARQYLAGRMTAPQQQLFGRQSLQLALRVRKRVVLGDSAPYEIVENSRTPSGIWWSHLVMQQINLDGKKIQGAESGSGSFSGVFGGGSSGSSIECKTVGQHRLEVICRIELRNGQFDSPNSTLVYKEDRALSADFQVVPESPADYIKFIEDPQSDAAIHSAIVPSDIQFHVGQSKSLHCNIGLKSLPYNVALDVFARFNGHEKLVGSVYGNAGSGTVYSINGAMDEDVPATIDLILRSSEKAASNTVDLTQIWNGELIYPNLPVKQIANNN